MRTSRRSDAGFTLPELLISIVILGVIAGAIAAAFITVLRNHEYSQKQIGETEDSLILTFWLGPDVQNATELGVDANPNTQTGCAASPVPTATNQNVLRLSWTDQSTIPATARYAAYRAVQPSVTTPWTLVRYACVSGAAPSSVLTVVDHLQRATGATVVNTGSRLGLNVTTDVDGLVSTFEVTGTRRTPSVTSTTAPPPTSPPTSQPN